MATLAISRLPVWRQLPGRVSRGLRRRARYWWQCRFGRSVAELDRLADEFAHLCLAELDEVDSRHRDRWSAILLRLGEHEAARRLQTLPVAAFDSHRAKSAYGDVLCRQLESILGRIRSTFERNLHTLPSSVFSDDPRCVALLEWAAGLPDKARVLDVGCGSGRFLHVLSQRLPHLRLIGVDVASLPLRELQSNIARVAGDVLSIPIADGSVDAAFAIESLEHSLRPRKALAEILRILGPGGRLLVIDKNRRWQRACDHEPWERWFGLDELSGWLTPFAEVDRCEYLPAMVGKVPPGLFCVWTATKCR